MRDTCGEIENAVCLLFNYRNEKLNGWRIFIHVQVYRKSFAHMHLYTLYHIYVLQSDEKTQQQQQKKPSLLPNDRFAYALGTCAMVKSNNI